MSWTRRLALMAALLALALAVVLFERDRPAAEVDARYGNAASRYVTLPDGSRLHYRDQGAPSGLPLVLVHGSNASLHTWEPWVAALGDRYRIVTLDLPGHGLTGRTVADDYSRPAYVASVHALADALALPPFVLGGNSMGGGVAWAYAQAHPERVRALVLVNASGPEAWRREALERAGAQGRSAGPLAFRLLGQPWFRAVARYLDPYYLVVQGLRASVHDPDVVTQALIDRHYELALRAGTRAATLARFAEYRGRAAAAPVDLGVLTVPALVLWGAEDAVIPAWVGERFARELPDARLIAYPEVGHMPMEEIPERSAADVRTFIRERVEESDDG